MTNDFLNYAHGFLLPHEGIDFENSPADSGNRGDGKTPGNYGTRFGIDAASHPGVDIVHLTQDQALEIYWRDWCVSRIDQMPYGIGVACFDEEENEGVHWGAVHLQAALNLQKGLALDGDTILVDGIIGPQTVAAAGAAAANVLGVTHTMLTLRSQRYMDIADRIPRLRPSLAGWLKRVEDMRSLVVRIQSSNQGAA